MATRVPKETLERIKAIYAKAHAEIRGIAKERRTVVESALKAKERRQIEEIQRRISSV